MNLDANEMAQRLEQHGDELQALNEVIAKMLVSFDSGKALAKASAKLAQKGDLMQLFASVEDDNVSQAEQMHMIKQISELMSRNPQTAVSDLEAYLDKVINDPNYEARKDYYSNIKTHVAKLKDSKVFAKYSEEYQAFQADDSEKAQAMRHAMDYVQNKTKEWLM